MYIYEFGRNDYVITDNKYRIILLYRKQPHMMSIGDNMSGFISVSKDVLEKSKKEYPFLKEFKNVKKFIEMDSEEFIDKFPEIFI